MGNRDFSDSIKLEVIKANLEKNSGDICCEVCGKKLVSISECHFDHIEPYAKGGKSSLDNCQILCVECNLKKNDKQLKDFVLEENAKRFFAGESLTQTEPNPEVNIVKSVSDKITKEEFDNIISDFIDRKGNIHKVDFGREYNHLPSIHYVRQYYVI
ncbi:MAG: HNH endonuclease [Clostridia bacterium]|nr:HNH endonuclease [Clostridia bacterium]